MILNFDLEKDTLPIGIIYGWTGGTKGTVAADRTNDLLDIMLEQMALLPEGPKIIAGDFNGTHDSIQHLNDMTTKHGWTDAGATRRLCPHGPWQNTCHANAGAKQSRIDLILANCHAESALSNFKVDHEDPFLTHRPVGVELTVQALRKKTRALVKPDNFSILIEERIDKEIQRATDDAKDQEQRNGNDTATKVDQGKIRKAIIDQLHLQMDNAIEDRKIASRPRSCRRTPIDNGI